MAVYYEHGPEAKFGLRVEPGDLVETVNDVATVLAVTDEEITVEASSGQIRNIRSAAVGTLRLLTRARRENQ